MTLKTRVENLKYYALGTLPLAARDKSLISIPASNHVNKTVPYLEVNANFKPCKLIKANHSAIKTINGAL